MASYSAVPFSFVLSLCAFVPLRIAKSLEFWAILERKELSAELATCGFPSGLRSCCPKSYPYLGIFDDRPPCAHAARPTRGLRLSRGRNSAGRDVERFETSFRRCCRRWRCRCGRLSLPADASLYRRRLTACLLPRFRTTPEHVLFRRYSETRCKNASKALL